MRQLILYGFIFVVVLVLALTLLLMRYQGKFEKYVPVVAALTTTGDGLPQNADVKYRGVLVGTVRGVEVAALGTIQNVDIRLKPEFASSIPSTVTARVVPSNLFAVTSVEFVDNGPGPGLEDNAVIHEDTSKGTIALQTAMTSLNNILSAIDPAKTGRVLGTIADALDGNGAKLGTSIERFDRFVNMLSEVYPDGQLEQSLDNFSTALHGINESAPELITVLGKSIEPIRTIANKRAQLAALLVGAGDTVGTVNTLFSRQAPGAGIELVGGLSQVFGGLAANPAAIPESVAGFEGALRALLPIFNFNGQVHIHGDVSFTPFKTYGPADCPHYGDMYGPRCGGPIESSPGFLPPGLIPKWLESAGPAPVLPVPAAAPAPLLPPPPLAGLLPGIPGIQLPGLPQLPGIIPPAPATKPAALGTVLGAEPNGSQALLLGSALTGLDVTVKPNQEAPHQETEDGER